MVGLDSAGIARKYRCVHTGSGGLVSGQVDRPFVAGARSHGLTRYARRIDRRVNDMTPGGRHDIGSLGSDCSLRLA